MYLSSCCLADKKDITTVLDGYAAAGVQAVELSGCHPYRRNMPEIVQSFDFRYLIHNYFPPPRKPFFLNLASSDPAVLKKSMQLAREAIVLCTKISSPIYGVHSGFRQDVGPDISFDSAKPITPYDAAFSTFCRSLRELARFACDQGVKLAFENQPALTTRGDVSSFITCINAGEYVRIIEDIGADKIGVLLDIPHLFSSAQVFGFDPLDFIERVKGYVAEIHLCQNQPGGVHAHLPLDANSPFLPLLRKCRRASVPVTLEVCADIKTLLEQARLVHEWVG